MKQYKKEQIIIEVVNLLKNYSDDKMCLLFANLLLNKVSNVENIIFSKEEISNFLFMRDSNQINRNIFYCLCRLNADVSEINFDGKIIKNLNFSNLEGVIINLDKVPDKDLSKVKFNGVMLNGTLDNAVIDYTDFTGYIGNIIINPQTIVNKSIRGSKLSGLTINGSFDNVIIRGVDFSDTKGDIRIDPQMVPNKELIGINFSNVLLCSNSNDGRQEWGGPIFDGCQIYDCKFKNTKGEIVINLDLLNSSIFPKLSVCDLTGVLVLGNAKSNYEPIHCVKEDGTVLFDDVGDDLFGSYYYDEQGNYVVIHLYQSMMWDDQNKCWNYVIRENEYNLKINVSFKEKKRRTLMLFGRK